MRIEHVHPGFTKWHANEHGEHAFPLRPVFHLFRGPEPEEAHCHPWWFEIWCLTNWYRALVFTLNEDRTRLLRTTEMLVCKGDHIEQEADTVHRIIDTHPDGCLTLANYGPCIRESLFYRFNPDGSILTRPWHQPQFEHR